MKLPVSKVPTILKSFPYRLMVSPTVWLRPSAAVLPTITSSALSLEKSVPLTLSTPIRLNFPTSIPVTDTPPGGPKLASELLDEVPAVDVLLALSIPPVSLTPSIASRSAT